MTLKNIIWWKSRHYYDTSYGERAPSTTIKYMLKNGEYDTKVFYDSGFLNEYECLLYLKSVDANYKFRNMRYLIIAIAFILPVSFLTSLIIIGGR